MTLFAATAFVELLFVMVVAVNAFLVLAIYGLVHHRLFLLLISRGLSSTMNKSKRNDIPITPYEDISMK